MTLDHAGPAGQGEHLCLAEGKAPPLLGGDLFIAHRPAVALCFCRIGIDHADCFAAQPPAQDRREATLRGASGQAALKQGGLEDQPLIRVHRPLHHVFPQAVGGGEQHSVAETGFRIDAEHHTGAGQIRAHHALHPDREGHLQVIEAVQLPVGDGSVGEQRRIATAAGLQQGLLPFDVQKGFLLAGEAGVRQVFSRGAGAHRH